MFCPGTTKKRSNKQTNKQTNIQALPNCIYAVDVIMYKSYKGIVGFVVHKRNVIAAFVVTIAMASLWCIE